MTRGAWTPELERVRREIVALMLEAAEKEDAILRQARAAGKNQQGNDEERPRATEEKPTG